MAFHLLRKIMMSSAVAEERVAAPIMKPSESQKYGTYLRQLSNDEIEKLLSSVLHELRRRDFEHLKGEFLDHGKALHKARASH
jgi:hypothetical protein